MKATIGLYLGLGIAFCAEAQNSTQTTVDTIARQAPVYAIAERGANQRVWERVTVVGTNRFFHKIVLKTNSYH